MRLSRQDLLVRSGWSGRVVRRIEVWDGMGWDGDADGMCVGHGRADHVRELYVLCEIGLYVGCEN